MRDTQQLRAGLGLRRGLMAQLLDSAQGSVDFLEVASENWTGVGGRPGRQFRELSERWPLFCHGLSLDLGGFAPLDLELLRAIRQFLDRSQAVLYSEHLSACADDGHLYELMPLPFTGECVRRVAERIRIVQDVIGRPLVIENVSAYARLPGEMSEPDFVRRVLEEADCSLLLDVNNIHVNSVNFGFDAAAYVAAIPCERIAYLHVAGHWEERPGLKIDTHGAPVADPVWGLLEHVYASCGVRPTLLERDFNLPPVSDLYAEIARIRCTQSRAAQQRSIAA